MNIFRIRNGFSGIIGMLFFCSLYNAAYAHTLPISEIRIVPDGSQIHMELKLNIFELKFISEIDRDNNDHIDKKEFKARQQLIKEYLLRSLKIETGGDKVAAKTSGVMLDVNSHHLIFRAHYPVDSHTESLKLTSELHAITSQAHITRVSYNSSATEQLAKLEARSNSVTFNPVATQMSGGFLKSYFNLDNEDVVLIIGFGLIAGGLVYGLKRFSFSKE